MKIESSAWLNSVEILPEWQKTAETIFSQPSIVLVIGAVDSGKTTFTKFLVYQGCQLGYKIGYVDGDMGQSNLGPPATIGLVMLNNVSSLEDLLSSNTSTISNLQLRFIGSTSPVRQLLPTVIEVKKLVEEAKIQGARNIIIDTTGLVHGYLGRELKFRKIELIEPQYIIALQKETELEHILSLCSRWNHIKIIRLPVSEKIKPKTREERRSFRQKKFAEYFNSANLKKISLKTVSLEGIWFESGKKLNANDYNFLEKILCTNIIYGEKNAEGISLLISGGYSQNSLYQLKTHYGEIEISITEWENLQNLLLGLNDENNFVLGLGILQDIDFHSRKEIKLLTPLSDSELEKVKIVQFGHMQLDKNGQEIYPNAFKKNDS